MKSIKQSFEKMARIGLTYYYCFRDKKTPSKPKKIIIGSVMYFLFPLDLIPDLIGPIGYVDDVSIFILALLTIKKYINDEHIEKANHFFKNKK